MALVHFFRPNNPLIHPMVKIEDKDMVRIELNRRGPISRPRTIVAFNIPFGHLSVQ
jgi:hypothetical protein